MGLREALDALTAPPPPVPNNPPDELDRLAEACEEYLDSYRFAKSPRYGALDGREGLMSAISLEAALKSVEGRAKEMRKIVGKGILG